MLKKIHEKCDIENLTLIEFMFESRIRIAEFIANKSSKFNKEKFNEVADIFLNQYPDIKRFGWRYNEGISFIYSKDETNDFFPMDFEVRSPEKIVSLTNHHSCFKNEYAKSYEFSVAFFKLIDISAKLSDYEHYHFSRSTNHAILAIDPDIENMFQNFRILTNSSLHLFRKNNYAMLYDRFSPVFFFEIKK